jgi:hypothetical protein
MAGGSTGGGGAGGASGGAGGAGGTGGATGGGGAGGGDACPMDPDKTEPGSCGCGVPDMDSVNGAGCGPLQDSIKHRYSFDTNANDSVGTKHGMLMNGATVASKALVLTGGASGGYVQLPAGMISVLGNATFEAWVTWTGTAGKDWQRIFDFGSNDGTDGTKYIFLSTRQFRTAYTSADTKSEVVAEYAVAFPSDTLVQVTVVVNDTGNSLNLYLNGNSVATANLDLPLSAIPDMNNWLGRSQYAADDYFKGTITEFRIYGAALTGPQVKTAYKMGADTTYLKK